MTVSAIAAAGDLDPTFGNGGIVTSASLGVAKAVAPQVDGKIVTVTDSAVVRYNTDGSFDLAFGSGGIVVTGFYTAISVAIQSDGKIVVVGYSNANSSYDFAVVRYNINGSLDTTFSAGGKVFTDVLPGSTDMAYSVVIQPDGKIIAAGGIGTGDWYPYVAFVRYNVDGSLDTTFGIGGKVTTGIFGFGDYGSLVALQPDGKIVVVGHSGQSFAVVRYNTDGSLDNSFGTGGIVTTQFPYSSVAYSVAIQPDGKILAVGGEYYDLDPLGVAVARYNADGSLDTTFGTGGIVETGLLSSGPDGFAYSVAIQSDGKAVVAGHSILGFGGLGINEIFDIIRFDPDGSLDTTFGNGGKVSTDLGSIGDEAYAVALQPDGNIVVAINAVIVHHFPSIRPAEHSSILRPV